MPIISGLERLRQKGGKFEVSWENNARPALQNKLSTREQTVVHSLVNVLETIQFYHRGVKIASCHLENKFMLLTHKNAYLMLVKLNLNNSWDQWLPYRTAGPRSCIFLMCVLREIPWAPNQWPHSSSSSTYPPDEEPHSWLGTFLWQTINEMSPSIHWHVASSVDALSGLMAGWPPPSYFLPSSHQLFTFQCGFLSFLFSSSSALSPPVLPMIPCFASRIVTIWEVLWTLSLCCHCG